MGQRNAKTPVGTCRTQKMALQGGKRLISVYLDVYALNWTENIGKRRPIIVCIRPKKLLNSQKTSQSLCGRSPQNRATLRIKDKIILAEYQVDH